MEQGTEEQGAEEHDGGAGGAKGTTPGAPPAVPRPLGSRARRQAWGEPRVRAWWLAAAAMLLVAAYVGAGQWAEASRARTLFQTGIPVQARITAIRTSTSTVQAGHDRDNFAVEPADRALFTLEFPTDQGLKTVQGNLVFQKGLAHPNDRVVIHYDPADPTRWTDRAEPVSLGRELMLPLAFLPVAGLLGVMAWWQRRRVLRLWREGPAREAVVVGTTHSAAAPFSRLVRCTLLHGRDKRVIALTVPRRAGGLEAGDLFWIVTAPHDPGRALAAKLYEEVARC